jgi:hypothetical protein
MAGWGKGKCTVTEEGGQAGGQDWMAHIEKESKRVISGPIKQWRIPEHPSKRAIATR